MRILFFGDVVGESGRDLLVTRLADLRRDYEADAVVANGENAAAGVGITVKIADALFAAGVDVITTGNHVWKHREIYQYLDEHPRIIRPYNLLPTNPGRGLTVVETRAGRLAIVNLIGQLYLEPARSPFEMVDEALEQVQGVRHVLVDFHAEATSEKLAMAHYLDGRVGALIGTHTHVRTADSRILARGTAYITDAGMCGARDSVIGVKKDQVIERFLTQLPVRFDPATADPWLEGVLVELNESGRAVRIEPFEANGLG